MPCLHLDRRRISTKNFTVFINITLKNKTKNKPSNFLIISYRSNLKKMSSYGSFDPLEICLSNIKFQTLVASAGL